MTSQRPEGALLRRLQDASVEARELEEMVRDPGARRYQSVRVALAAHPRTPRREALALVGTLFWRGLARLSADPRVHPEVRRAADRDLARRLPEMALAERIDLARTVGRGTLLTLRFDPNARVLAAVLDNRFTTEPDVVQAVAQAGSGRAGLEVITGHPRWSLRPGVRSALLRNPRLPPPAALALLSRASAEDLEGLRAAPSVSPLLRACAERVLARRLGQD